MKFCRQLTSTFSLVIAIYFIAPTANAGVGAYSAAAKIGDDVVMEAATYNTSPMDHLVISTMGIKAWFTWPGDFFNTPWTDTPLEANEAIEIAANNVDENAAAGYYAVLGSHRYLTTAGPVYLPSTGDNVTVQPPSNLSSSWSLGGCHTCDCTEWEVSHSATDATSYTVFHSVSNTGPWTTYSSTTGPISYPHNGTSGRWFKIRALNAAGHIESSPIWRTGSYCDNCGGGGEEP